MKRTVLAGLVVTLTCAGQLQLQAPPAGFSGALVKFSEESVTLKDKDGKEIVVAMTPGWTVSSARTVDSSAIKPGDFVATANTVMDDSAGKSTELRILEPGYRPEYGTHLMAEQVNTAMTHGTVKTAVRGAAGVELQVEYPGGSRRILVAPGVRVTGFDLLSRDRLKPGVMVSAVVRKGPDGVPRAGRLVLAQ